MNDPKNEAAIVGKNGKGGQSIGRGQNTLGNGLQAREVTER
jgi:hypothetical protein